MDYPPKVSLATFQTRLSHALAATSDGGIGAQTTLPCGQQQMVEEVPQCALQSLKLKVGAVQSESFQDQNHAAVLSNFCFAPTVENPDIVWVIDNPALVVTAELQLLRRGAAAPIWRRVLTAEEITAGTLNWNGNLGGNTTEFPDAVPTIDFSPYSMIMTITGPHAQGKAVAWTYFDVRVKKITLAFGAKAVIPPARNDIADATKANVLAWQNVLVDGLATTSVHGDHVLYLQSDLYCTNLGNQGDTDYSYRQYRDLWGNGPTLPLTAEIEIEASDGTGTLAAAKAIGNARFVWDWSDPVADKVAAWVQNETARTQQYLRDSLDYKVSAEWDRKDAPRSSNCHVHHGGKRGRGAKPVFPAQAGDGQPFPFAVSACNERRWSATSLAVRDTLSPHASRTGVLFQPSRIAGDTYKVAVYFDYAGQLPYDADAATLTQEVPSRLRDESGKFTTMRRIDCTLLKKDPTVVVAAPALASRYDPAGINIVLNQTMIAAGAWRTALDAAMLKSPPQDWFQTFVNANQGGPYTISVAPAANLGALVLARAIALRVGGAVIITVNTIQAHALRPPCRMHAVATGPGGPGWTIAGTRPAGADVEVLLEAGGPALGAAVTLPPLQGAPQPPNGTVMARRVATQQEIADDFLGPEAARATPGAVTMQVKNLADFIQEAYLKAHHRAPDGAVTTPGVFMFLYMDRCEESTDGASSGAASSKTAMVNQANIYTCFNAVKANVVNAPPQKAFDTVLAHEIAHGLALPHYSGGAPILAGVARVHMVHTGSAADNNDCLMNYDVGSTAFCGLCILRLRGWSLFGNKEERTAQPAVPAGASAALLGHEVPSASLFTEGKLNKLTGLVTQVRVSLSATPPKTKRLMPAKTSHNLPLRREATYDTYSHDAAILDPLVLMHGTADGAPVAEADSDIASLVAPINLTAEGDLPPDALGRVVWRIQRSADDHAHCSTVVPNPQPTLNAAGHVDSEATLFTDAVGSFDIKVQYVEPGESFDEAKAFVCVHVVLVHVRLSSAKRRHYDVISSYCKTEVVGTDLMMHTQNATADNFAFDDKKLPLRLRARLLAVGGGADGRRGLDKVRAGWINNVAGETTFARYERNPPSPTLPAHWVVRERHLRKTTTDTLEALQPPVDATHPLLDKGVNANVVMATWGAGQATLSQSRPTTAFDQAGAASSNPAGCGMKCWVEVVDAPMTSYDLTMPTDAAFALTKLHHGLSFRAYLCVWADLRAQRGNLLGVLEEVQWTVDGEISSDPNRRRVRIERKYKVEKGANTRHPSLMAARSTGLEYCPPAGLAIHKPRLDDGSDIGLPFLP